MMNTIKYLLSGISLLSIMACNTSNMNQKAETPVRTGHFIAELELRDSVTLPFDISISEKHVVITNGKEEISIQDFELNDSLLSFEMPVFNSRIELRFEENWKGYWYNITKGPDYKIPMTLVSRDERFPANGKSNIVLAPKWKVTFSPNTEDAYPAIGQFKQLGHKVTGTFLTETGDYRFLEGVIRNRNSEDQLLLSCFDGSHAFLFEAIIRDGKMKGTFYSGNHWKEPFVAEMNDEFELQSADSLTFLKPGYDRFSFSFPDLKGDTINSEELLTADINIVQILGSWCPNCMDETEYLVNLKREFPALNIVGLCFEMSDSYESAMTAVNKMRKDLQVNYPMLIAGTSSKKMASEKLPMLNKIMSYPTTIICDKNGKVLLIHTGFNGSGTGDLFEKFDQKFRKTLGLINRSN